VNRKCLNLGIRGAATAEIVEYEAASNFSQQDHELDDDFRVGDPFIRSGGTVMRKRCTNLVLTEDLGKQAFR
jgi:hypothetical protein